MGSGRVLEGIKGRRVLSCTEQHREHGRDCNGEVRTTKNPNHDENVEAKKVKGQRKEWDFKVGKKILAEGIKRIGRRNWGRGRKERRKRLGLQG